MITISDDKRFALSNAFFSYVMDVTPEGLLRHIYYGATLRRPLDAVPHHVRVRRGAVTNFEGVADLDLNDMPQEYPTFGRSDFRYPAFHGLNADGNSVFSLAYKSHRIMSEKPDLEGLPSARGGQSETLIITLEDPLFNVEAELFYTVYEDYGVLSRSVRFANHGKADIHLQHAFSSALELPDGSYEILHLHGTWSREFNEERIDLPTGRFAIESSRGTSSAAHNPFMAVMEKGASESAGSIYASALMYSGNFAMSTERGEFGSVRILTGLNSFNFQWTLSPGQHFYTPEALHVFSGNGLGQMSYIWHEFVREKISPPAFHCKARPTYLNTWEAAYFDVDEDKVLHLADKAAEIGVDMLVLDDGWFEGRRSDNTSLGDWTADKARFPSGIPALAQKVKAKGLKFGLWFEPEMVNPQSQLFRDHPDWILHVPGRIPSLGRNQLTLDLSRPEVTDYLFKQVDDILSCGNIDYVKWDMNRNMTEAGSRGHPAENQQEISHRYMIGLYRVLQKITQKYPDILFENCASGGNRFDLGMLRFMGQNWTSDMCDPMGRLDIINGGSYMFPLDVMAAYIGPSPNHQNGRISSLKTRFDAGVFCAARGISLGEKDIDLNKRELKRLMAFAKETAPDMVGGYFDRLSRSDNEVCWQYRSRNLQTVYLAWFQILSAPNLPLRRVRMSGLDPDADYILTEDGRRFAGDALMQHGLLLPYGEKADFCSHLFIFKKVSS